MICPAVHCIRTSLGRSILKSCECGRRIYLPLRSTIPRPIWDGVCALGLMYVWALCAPALHTYAFISLSGRATTGEKSRHRSRRCREHVWFTDTDASVFCTRGPL